MVRKTNFKTMYSMFYIMISGVLMEGMSWRERELGEKYGGIKALQLLEGPDGIVTAVRAK